MAGMSRFEPFWEVMCAYTQFLWLGVMTMLFLFVLGLLSLWFADPGTASYAITIVSLAMILVAGSAVSGMFWVCRKRTQRF